MWELTKHLLWIARFFSGAKALLRGERLRHG
jgi:hypothetical protein